MCDDCGPSMGEEAQMELLIANAGFEDVPDDEIWEGSGGKILIVKMPDGHLNNAIAWLDRTLAKMSASGWEMAPNGMDRQIGLEIDEMEHKSSLLKEERARRGLRPEDPFAPLKPFIVGSKERRG